MMTEATVTSMFPGLRDLGDSGANVSIAVDPGPNMSLGSFADNVTDADAEVAKFSQTYGLRIIFLAGQQQQQQQEQQQVYIYREPSSFICPLILSASSMLIIHLLISEIELKICKIKKFFLNSQLSSKRREIR